MTLKLMKSIKKLAKNFDLKYNPKAFSYIILTKEDIVLRNFLGGCPEPDYNKFGKKKKRFENILLFIKSNEFKSHKKKPQGCVVDKKGILQELRLIKKINDNYLRKKLIALYTKILNNIQKEMILISRSTNNKEKELFLYILSHELVHQLLNSNNLSFQLIKKNSWKWNEGICVYMDHFIKNRHKLFASKPKKTKNKMWNIYSEYAHRWHKLLKNTKSAQQRKKILLKKYNQLNAKIPVHRTK